MALSPELQLNNGVYGGYWPDQQTPHLSAPGIDCPSRAQQTTYRRSHQTDYPVNHDVEFMLAFDGDEIAPNTSADGTPVPMVDETFQRPLQVNAP